jgi:DNA-directed RNA polymerase subunit RPC12/RpoP
MLSRASRQEIVRKLEAQVGHPFAEVKLSAESRRAIDSLTEIQRNLFAISEVLNGEQSRVKQSALLSLSSKLRKDNEIETHVTEVNNLQKEIDNKISEISAHILQEEAARRSGHTIPKREGGLEAVELKCPSCSAALPMPTGRFVKCEYCGTTLSIRDVSSQIKEMIQSI